MLTHLLLASFVLALVAAGRAAQAEERSKVPEKMTWNLQDLYPSDAAWATAKDGLAKRIPELAAYKGHLGDSAESLFKALTLYADLNKEAARLLSYASQLSDQDTRVSTAMAMLQAMEQVAADLGSAGSFLRPEILAIDKAKLDGFVASDPRLKDWQFAIETITRLKDHTLGPSEEQVVAQANGQMAGNADSIYTVFTNADMPYPEVTLSTGEKVRMDAANYTKYRASSVRADRDEVFKKFWGKYSDFRRTLGNTLYSQVKAHIFNKEVRNYDSCLQASLDANNIPTTVYTQLIADVHRNLPTLHRYLKLRKRMMGVDQLRYEDLYASIVNEVEMPFTPEEGMELTLKAFAPLGPTYVDALRKGYESRWVDFMPSEGKKSGAYSNGAAYDVHPYQLLNYMGQYEDVSTLAHESGHSMHSYLSNKNQPYQYADYSIFVAEVASTFNENLLMDHMLRNVAKDDAARLYLLGSQLDGFRQTLFRQTLFAEFELKLHEMAEKGEPLTGDNLSAMYLGLLKEYYGDAQGVCKVDDLYGVEWAYIPHFYYNFYVYQYSTSLVASTAIAKGVKEEAAANAKVKKNPAYPKRDGYLKMLSSGSSVYPMELLKTAGVDMTTSAPFDAAMVEMNQVMDQIESILDKQAKAGAKK
jgi:oligoendopeptidase F